MANEDPNVEKSPSPTVRLKEFAASALIFELVIWTSKLMHRQGVMKSRMNLAINKKLEENNIIIPFQQLDVKIKS